MTGIEHYERGLELLEAAEYVRRMHDGGIQDDAESHVHADALLREAQAHFAAARVAPHYEATTPQGLGKLLVALLKRRAEAVS